MSKKSILPLLIPFIVFITSCNNERDIDTEKPTIDINFYDAFPLNCDTIYFGETFVVKIKFSDNVELGAFSIDMHNNFDHHSHSTEVTACSFAPKKEPVNPFVFIDDYSIPEGLKEYNTNVSVAVPEGNGSGLFDEGDYHFFISLTDKEGWSAQMGLSIKMLHR